MAEHRCPSILMLAALYLATRKELSAHEATYNGLPCPTCKRSTRTTRLASTIHTLRHDWGWDIKTERAEGLQAIYLVDKVGEMPKSAAKPPKGMQEWTCLGYKRTSRGPGPRAKEFATHGITYPNQPDQTSTTDADGRWAWGHCADCEQVTMWQKKGAAQ